MSYHFSLEKEIFKFSKKDHQLNIYSLYTNSQKYSNFKLFDFVTRHFSYIMKSGIEIFHQY